jgi:hypothetical protein
VATFTTGNGVALGGTEVAVAGIAVGACMRAVAVLVGDGMICTGLTWIMGVPASGLETRVPTGMHPTRVGKSRTNTASKINFLIIETSVEIGFGIVGFLDHNTNLVCRHRNNK